MTRILPYLLIFILLLNILTYSACARTVTEKAREFRTSKRQNQPKPMYSMIMESSKLGNQRTIPGLHVVKHIKIAGKAKVVYGGANDIRRPRNGHNGANSISVKSSSLFGAALRHLVLGLLLWVCFF